MAQNGPVVRLTSAQSAKAFVETIDLSALRADRWRTSHGPTKSIGPAGAQYTSARELRDFAEAAPVLTAAESNGKTAAAAVGGKSDASAAPEGEGDSITSIAKAIGGVDGIQQAFVSGNNLISFDEGVTAARRFAAINCSLLAELVSDVACSDRTKSTYIADWTATYYDTMVHVGWVKQDDRSGSQNLAGNAATVEATVFDIAAGLVGPGGAAMVKGILDGLGRLTSGDPVLTLFQQHSTSAAVADATIGLGSNDPSGGFIVNLTEFDVSATGEDTQVLFFKWNSSHATVNYRHTSLVLDDSVYALVADDIAAKIAGFTREYVKELSVGLPNRGA